MRWLVIIDIAPRLREGAPADEQLKRIPTRPSVRAATSWPESQRSPQLGLLNSEKTPQHCLLGVCFGFDQGLDISDHRKFAYLSVSAGGDDRRRHGRVPRLAEGGARQDGQAACAAAGGRGAVRQRVSEPSRAGRRRDDVWVCNQTNMDR